jgi:hypothetical protein
MTRSYKQGRYEVINKEKYCGTSSIIRYLSSYELQTFKYLDRTPSIIKWSAEQVIVPYYNPLKQRQARYIVDLYIKYRNKYGEIIEELVEVKSSHETIPPTKGKKKKSTYETQMATWITNQAKWTAAQQYANERGWRFRILTENSIFS